MRRWGGRRRRVHGRYGRNVVDRSDTQDLSRVDPVRILHDVAVQSVDLGPQEGIAEIGSGQIPQRIPCLDDVGAPLRRLLCESDGGHHEREERRSR